MFKIVRGSNPRDPSSLATMPTYETRVLLFLNAAQELPVDIQREILKYYPPPKLSPRMQGFLARWKARPANV